MVRSPSSFRHHCQATNARVIVSASQPETTFQIFNRTIHDLDVATGKKYTAGFFGSYTTTGPTDSYAFKSSAPPSLPVECNMYDIVTTCTIDQLEAIMDGKAEVEGIVVVKPEAGGGPFGDGAAF